MTQKYKKEGKISLFCLNSGGVIIIFCTFVLRNKNCI